MKNQRTVYAKMTIGDRVTIHLEMVETLDNGQWSTDDGPEVHGIIGNDGREITDMRDLRAQLSYIDINDLEWSEH